MVVIGLMTIFVTYAIGESERMPPDNRTDKFIFTNLYYDWAEPLIYTGYRVNMLGIIDGDAWTPYTPEAWKLLNPKID